MIAGIHVETQCLENYGAHAEDGKFQNGNALWKFKPGSDYILTGLDSEQQAMAFVMSLCQNSTYWKEYPVSRKPVDAAIFATDYEKSQQENEGKVQYHAYRIHVPTFMEEHGNVKTLNKWATYQFH
jgi:hypothetical protein